MTTQTRTIDQSQFHKFRDLAEILWRGGQWGYLWFKQGDKKHTYWVDAKYRDVLVKTVVNKDIYFGVYPTNEKGKPTQRATITDIVALNCLFREYDLKDYGEDKAALQLYVETLDPFPSVIVETAGGFHVYWLFEETVPVDQDKIDYYKNALHGWNAIDKFADPAAKDLARVLRVPGTFNQKEHYSEDQRLTKIILWEIDRRYDGAKLLRQGLAHHKVQQDLQSAVRETQRGVISPHKGINEVQLKKYVNEILSDVDKVAQAPSGQRTSLMFAVAVRLGEVVASGALDYSDARQMMINACVTNGLVGEDGLANITKQIENGLDKGKTDGTPLDLTAFEHYQLTQRGITINDDIGETPDPRHNDAPPERNAVNSEMAFLGLILNNASAFQDITGRYNIEAGHLANPRHQIIYSAIGAVALTGHPDLISVMDLLRRKKQLDNNGGKDYLEALCASDGNYASLPNYVKAIMDAYVSRQMTGVQTGIGRINGNPSLSADEKIAEMAKLVEQVQTPQSAAVVRTGHDALSKAYDWIENAMDSDFHASTGYANLDVFGQFAPGELIGLFGRPGMGKTALQINLMHNLMQQRRKVAYVSLELTEAQIMGRWAAMVKNIPNGHFPKLNKHEYNTFLQFMGEFAGDLFFINDLKGQTPAQILSWMKRVHLEHGVTDFFGDHYGRVRYPVEANTNKREAMGDFALDLFEFAGDYQATVTWAGQLNRNCEQRANKRPVQSDVGDSDLVTQISDRMWFLYRDSYYRVEQPGMEKVMEIIVDKNRNYGDIGTAYVEYNRLYQQIRDVNLETINLNKIEDVERIPEPE